MGETRAVTTGFVGDDQLEASLEGAEIVVIPAGVPRKPGMTSDVTEAKYFSTPVVLGPNGLEKNLGLGALTAFEQDLLKASLPELNSSIKKGEEFAANF